MQPWARANRAPARVPISLHHRVYMEPVPHGAVYLAMEPLPEAILHINGIRVPLEETPMRWVDSCFRVYAIPQAVWRPGENRLELSGRYGEDCGLEAMYLLGAFGVWMRGGVFRIGSLPPTLRPGSLVSQGLPFYGGKLRYDYAPLPEGTYLAKMPRIGGSCAVVSWGEQRRTLLWPWQEETLSLPAGQGLSLEVVLTRRNAFGPLHQFPRKQPYIAPDSFENGTAPDYSLFPTGLLQKWTLYPVEKEK